MASIIIYNSNQHYIKKTIADLIDKTHKSLIDEIIVCDDTGSSGDEIPHAEIIYSDMIGRARAWNIAAEWAKSNELVF